MLKKISYILLLCGLISLAICYIVIPENTKSAMDIVINYLNTPIGIAEGVTITVGGILFVFFSKTSIGKKALKKMQERFTKVEEKVTKINVETDAFIEASNYQIEMYKKMYEDKMKSMNSKFDYIESNFMSALEQIPNKKVQDKVAEFKTQYKELKLQSDLVIGTVNEEVLNYKEEQENKLLELQEKMNSLMNSLKEEFEHVQEAINSQTEEE